MTAVVAGKNLKYVSLVVLIAQTTALVLVLRYSKTQKVDGPRYISSTAIVMAEAVKMVTCIVVLFHSHSWQLFLFLKEIRIEIIEKRKETLKIAVPAVLYVIQNNLLFLALQKLDAATYQVTYQLKILTTAFFSVTMLGRSLNRLKWISLILLTGGVTMVQMTADKPSKSSNDGKSDSIIGLIAVLAACLSSGFAGVYFEKILKTTNVSLWMRNLQLGMFSFFSIFGGLLMCWLYDWKAIEKNGFLQGYNVITWIVVLLQAYGGLVIALVVKYADNILKGFAVSLSIILSSLVSWLFLADFTPTLIFALGATTVIASTFMYGYEPKVTPLRMA
ncbi:putative UDP-galactose translocator [Dictyocaulus viviparus]|uniref:Putative UDP-galactose translocator n=1 Tax=Dictyocaulus viviparus TaxID=29172 RepID=A0A0D8Y6R0_DICVI|nr:putative UDP-galactose translocator [Dictyocaulus viviparus]